MLPMPSIEQSIRSSKSRFSIFSMYDGQTTTVNLLCADRLMNYVVDRFGDEIKAEIVDEAHFTAEEEISVR